MARLNIYLLLTKLGPDRDAQMKIIQNAVQVDRVHDQIYVDDLRKRRSRRDHRFPMRDAAIRHTRPGDTMVIASAGMIGIGRDDVRAVLHLLHTKGIPLLDASTRKTIMWSDEVADNLAFLDRSEKEYRALVAANARVSRRTGRPTKAMRVTEAEAEAMWRDTARYPSQKQVAEAVGLSVRAMYLKYKKRHLTPSPRKKPPPQIVAPDGHNFVYVMWRSDGFHKIGFSRNLTVRLKTLSDLMKQPLKLVHYIQRPGDAHEAEQYAHVWAGLPNRRDGEWFELDEARAVKAIQSACDWIDISNEHKRRRVLLDAAEKALGQEMTRAEVEAYFEDLEKKDEADD